MTCGTVGLFLQDHKQYEDYIVFIGTKSPVHHTTFMCAMDDSMETFLSRREVEPTPNGTSKNGTN